ncbi:MAG: ATP-binding protein [Ignavibacteriaceae bacterium]|jgi:predicted AAA+ superfamily ATPase|nr:ATP-binding protein [Ignavibacteriaceae bacterium]
MKQLFYRYNPWWDGEYNLEHLFPRPDTLEKLDKSVDIAEVTFISGLRRVGKTTLLRMLIKSLIDERGVDPLSIFYISLDDYLLQGKNIPELIDEYRKTVKKKFEEKIYLFFDEVTYFPDYEIQLKNIFDSQNVKIFASSSSASLIRDKKPYLTGRNRILEVDPLTFEEYLIFKGIELKHVDGHLTDVYFEEYLKSGGIPEFVKTGDFEYLKNLVDDIIMKDISALHNIKNTSSLKEMYLLLMERSGKSISLNKVANILELSPDTVKRFLTYFEEVFLISTISKCGKTNQSILSLKKIYSVDLGLINLFTGFRDKGSLFENYLFNKIKKYQPCYYAVDGYEIDFLIDKKVLIESKYHSDLVGKQLDLFNNSDFKHKYLITSQRDLESLMSDLTTMVS